MSKGNISGCDDKGVTMPVTTNIAGIGAHPEIPKTLPNRVMTTSTTVNSTGQLQSQVTKLISVQQDQSKAAALAVV